MSMTAIRGLSNQNRVFGYMTVESDGDTKG